MPCCEFSFRNSYRLAGINQTGETALFFISRKPRPSARRQKKSITYSLCNSSSVIIQCSFRSAILSRWLAGRLLLHLSGSVSAPQTLYFGIYLFKDGINLCALLIQIYGNLFLLINWRKDNFHVFYCPII